MWNLGLEWKIDPKKNLKKNWRRTRNGIWDRAILDIRNLRWTSVVTCLVLSRLTKLLLNWEIFELRFSPTPKFCITFPTEKIFSNAKFFLTKNLFPASHFFINFPTSKIFSSITFFKWIFRLRTFSPAPNFVLVFSELKIFSRIKSFFFVNFLICKIFFSTKFLYHFSELENFLKYQISYTTFSPINIKKKIIRLGKFFLAIKFLYRFCDLENFSTCFLEIFTISTKFKPHLFKVFENSSKSS